MELEVDPQHVIGNLKQQIAQKSEEAAVNAAAASSAVQRVEVLEKQLEDCRKEIEALKTPMEGVKAPTEETTEEHKAEVIDFGEVLEA